MLDSFGVSGAKQHELLRHLVPAEIRSVILTLTFIPGFTLGCVLGRSSDCRTGCGHGSGSGVGGVVGYQL